VEGMITLISIKKLSFFSDIEINIYVASRFFVGVQPMKRWPTPPGNGAPGE